MTVKQILERKEEKPITVDPETSLYLATQLMKQSRIGALLVLDDDENLVGIFTERDVVYAVGGKENEAMGQLCLKDPVKNYMVRDVKTCSVNTSIDVIMQMMTDGRFRHVPVTDETGGILGMVSIGDVVKDRMEKLEKESRAMRDYIMHS